MSRSPLGGPGRGGQGGHRRALQDELEGTENRIAVARTDYNESVGQVNAFIRTFPYNLTTMISRQRTPREYFEASPGAAEAPRVEF